MAEKAKITEKAFVRQITVSIGIIVICMLCMAVSSWAMFSDEQLYTGSVLMGANFDVKETIVKKQEGLQLNPAADGSYQLLAGEYEITFTAVGSAKEWSGFGLMRVNDTEYYTLQLLPENNTPQLPHTQKITLTVADGTYVNLKFTSFWGTCTATERLADNGSISVTGLPVSNTVTEEEENSTEENSTKEDAPTTPDAEDKQEEPPTNEDTEGNTIPNSEDEEQAPADDTATE